MDVIAIYVNLGGFSSIQKVYAKDQVNFQTKSKVAQPSLFAMAETALKHLLLCTFKEKYFFKVGSDLFGHCSLY